MSLGGSYFTGSFSMYILTVNGYEDTTTTQAVPTSGNGSGGWKNLFYYKSSIYLKGNMILLPSSSKVTGGGLSKYRTRLLS